jgi:hypothetical protein
MKKHVDTCRTNIWDTYKNLDETAGRMPNSCFSEARDMVKNFAVIINCNNEDAYWLLGRLNPINFRGFVTHSVIIPYNDCVSGIAWLKEIVPVLAKKFRKDEFAKISDEQLVGIISRYIQSLNPAPTPHYINIDQIAIPRGEEWTINGDVELFLKIMDIDLSQIDKNPNRAVRAISIVSLLLKEEPRKKNPMNNFILNLINEE